MDFSPSPFASLAASSAAFGFPRGALPGKTVQTIGFLAFLRERGTYGPFLIVGPLSTINNWHAEFQKWAPSIPSLVYHGSKEVRALPCPRHRFLHHLLGHCARGREGLGRTAGPLVEGRRKWGGGGGGEGGEKSWGASHASVPSPSMRATHTHLPLLRHLRRHPLPASLARPATSRPQERARLRSQHMRFPNSSVNPCGHLRARRWAGPWTSNGGRPPAPPASLENSPSRW